MTEDLNDIESGLRRISELEDSIRDFINAGRNQSGLLDKKPTWNQICSSLDVIGDTTLSIQDYLATPYPASDGIRYIYTYGILQSLFLQQDSVRHLSEAFDIQYSASEELLNIRDIRNSAIGHPTKQRIKKEILHNYISRISLRKDGFALMRSSAENDTQIIDVDIIGIIYKQTKEIQMALALLSEKLEEADRMHREKFGQQRLQDLFHTSIGYLFEKVSQGIHSPSLGNESFGFSMLCSIEKMYSEYEKALIERRELNDYTRYDLDEYKYAISVLKSYLSDNAQELSERDARIYLFFLRERHDHFVQIAIEIDSDYGERPNLSFNPDSAINL